MSTSTADAAEVVALLKMANLSDGAVIYDLGCGWGRLASALGRAFPNAEIRGIEISPFPYFIARLRTRSLANVSIHRGDFHRWQARFCVSDEEDSNHPELQSILDIEKRKFLENAINMLLECENRGVHIRWILERFYPHALKPETTAEENDKPRTVTGVPENSSNYSAKKPDGWEPLEKLWILMFCQEWPADEARRRSMSATDL